LPSHQSSRTDSSRAFKRTDAAPTSSNAFKDLGVPTDMVNALNKAGIAEPFPIQQGSLPAAFDGKDLCGRAPTGSGKTLAFALPVAALAKKAAPKRPTALILTPTRELAAQIREALLPLAQVRRRSVATIYGGTAISRDVQRLQQGVDIVVATPGRLEDLIQRKAIYLSDVQMVVLDEADRMADMGFLPVVTRILDQTNRDRQTLLFSATLDGDIDVLVKRYQNNPVRVEIDEPVEEAGDVRHLFWPVEKLERRHVVAQIIKDISPAIVFTRTKRGADRLTKQLKQAGINADAIHGDRSQNQRERALRNFTRGESSALIATDVAARGIHVDDVAVVVHYDPPGTDKDYVHRSGRTGRAGATGIVVSLVHPEVQLEVDDLQRDLHMTRGLHALDFKGMTSDVVPETVQPTRQGAIRPAKKVQGGGAKRGGGGGGRGGAGGGGGGRPRKLNSNGDAPGTHRGERTRSSGGGSPGQKPKNGGGGAARGKGGSRQRNTGG
jgi:superfamily II DNA/RNA helicase